MEPSDIRLEAIIKPQDGNTGKKNKKVEELPYM